MLVFANHGAVCFVPPDLCQILAPIACSARIHADARGEPNVTRREGRCLNQYNRYNSQGTILITKKIVKT